MNPVTHVKIGEAVFGSRDNLPIIAGPCVIEDLDTCLTIAHHLKQISAELSVPFVYKASYDKANRSSRHSYRGPGLQEGLKVLERVRAETGLPVYSDVHSTSEVPAAAQVLDALQIPAFLCRQTDLLQAAAATGLPVNVKKGQFLSPHEMKNVVEKIEAAGSRKILLTERGTFFGYGNLVNDFRSIPIMAEFGYPVLYDATHSAQLPGSLGTATGGSRKFIPTLAAAAVAAGCHALFLEVHPNPEKALSDPHNSLPLSQLRDLTLDLLRIHRPLYSTKP